MASQTKIFKTFFKDFQLSAFDEFATVGFILFLIGWSTFILRHYHDSSVGAEIWMLNSKKH